MITYLKLSKKPKQFPSFTGVTLQQFDAIAKDVKKQYPITEKARLSKRKRLRKIGAGHKFDLSVQDKLVMLPCVLQTIHNV